MVPWRQVRAIQKAHVFSDRSTCGPEGIHRLIHKRTSRYGTRFGANGYRRDIIHDAVPHVVIHSFRPAGLRRLASDRTHRERIQQDRIKERAVLRQFLGSFSSRDGSQPADSEREQADEGLRAKP